MYRHKILGKEELEVFNYLKDKFMPDAVIAGGAVRDLIMEKPFKDIDIWFNHTKVGIPQRFFELSLPKELGFKCGEDYVDIPLNFAGERMRTAPDEEVVDFEEPGGRPATRPGMTTLRGIERAAQNIAGLTVTGTPRRFTFDNSAFQNVAATGSMPPTMAKARHKVLYSFSMYYKGVQYQIMNLGMSPKGFVKEAFDIGFCKAMHDGKKIIRLPEFDTDLKNKTLTLDGKTLGAANFKWAMEKHIPRLLKLYPDFKVNVTSHPPEEKKRNPQISYEQEINRIANARVDAMTIGQTRPVTFAAITTSAITWDTAATPTQLWDDPVPAPEPQPRIWPVVAEDEFGRLDDELLRRPPTTHPAHWVSSLEVGIDRYNAGTATPQEEVFAMRHLNRLRAGLERAVIENDRDSELRYRDRVDRFERLIMGVR